MTHGGRTPARVDPLASEILSDLEQALAGTPAGDPSFALARGALATRLARLSLVSEWLSDHGPLAPDGEVRGAARFEQDCIGAVERALAALGLTPVSAAALGVDLGRAASLADLRRDALDEARQHRLAAEGQQPA